MSNLLSIKNPLHAPIQYNGGVYFTSQYFHQQYKANAGVKYDLLKNFNALIRSIETYQNYVERGDIIELTYIVAKEYNILDVLCLFEYTQYNQVLLMTQSVFDYILNIPRVFDKKVFQWLYVIKFSNGCVKAGKSSLSDCRIRIKQHGQQALSFNINIEESFFGKFSISEQHLLKFCLSISEEVLNKEYFYGCDYSDVVEHLNLYQISDR